MHTTRVDVRDWAGRVFGWDGILPIGIAVLPAGIALVLPNADGVLSVVAGIAPIAALFIRYYVGRRHLASNRVGPVLRAGQGIVFVAAIFWMCLLDCFVMILHFVPAVKDADYVAVGIGYGVYLVAMSFAMYPGRVECVATEDAESWNS